MNILDELASWVQVEKQADDMGSTGTTHPSAGVDDQTIPAPEGARASENESDVKADVPGQSVNTASETDAEGSGRGENSPVHDIGVKSTATGEDPSIETPSANSGRTDPGTSHPANMAHGEKYSSLLQDGNDILASISVAQAIGDVEKPAEVASKAAPVDASGKGAAEVCVETEEKEESEGDEEAEEEDEEKVTEAQLDEARTAGAQTADLLFKLAGVEIPTETPTTEETEGEEKPASAEELDEARKAGGQFAEYLAKEAELQAVATVRGTIETIIKTAEQDAANVAEFLAGYEMSLAKKSEDALEGAIQMEESSEGAEEEAPMPPAVPELPVEEEAVAGGDEEQVLADIAEALVEQGVTPEELLAQSGAEEAVAEPAPALEDEALAEALVPAASVKFAELDKAGKCKAIVDTLRTLVR
jgi:hypothetical protein